MAGSVVRNHPHVSACMHKEFSAVSNVLHLCVSRDDSDLCENAHYSINRCSCFLLRGSHQIHATSSFKRIKF